MTVTVLPSRIQVWLRWDRHAQELGTQLWEGTKVTQVHGNLEEGFGLLARSRGKRVRVQARAVIEAFGKRSNLDHALNRTFITQQHPYMAVKTTFRGPSLSKRIDLHTFPGGYCGVSDIEGSRSVVCALVLQPVFQRASNGTGGVPHQNFLG